MTEKLSQDAQRIINAALEAAKSEGHRNVEGIERAVDEAVGGICSDNLPHGEEAAVEALKEIVKIYIRRYLV